MLNISLNNTQVGKVVCNYNQSINFDTRNKVEDDIKGYIVNVNNGWEFVGIAEYKKKYGNMSLIKVALILESPHKAEFSNTYVPICPANGRTGNNIEKKFTQVSTIRQNLLQVLNVNQCCEIYVMNPVQYQCSCAYYLTNSTNRAYTEKVFRMLFNKNNGNLRLDFINRLQAYNPDYLINACTHSLKNVVKTAIKESQLGNCKVLQNVKHPSVW